MLDSFAFFFFLTEQVLFLSKSAKDSVVLICIEYSLIFICILSFPSKQNYSFFGVIFSHMSIHTQMKCIHAQLRWTYKDYLKKLLLSGFCGGSSVVMFKIDQIVLKIKFLLILSTASEFSNVVCFT